VKRWALPIGVAAALAVAAFALRGRSRQPETADGTVSAFFAAAKAGDDDAYVRLTSGQLRATLENTRSQLGAAAFRESLRQTAAGIKGLATTAGSDAPPGQTAVEVDIVFADRNERQRMFLAPLGAGWTIDAITAADMRKPSVPYGTPVFDEASGPPKAEGGQRAAEDHE
jgi:hypothetical protein